MSRARIAFPTLTAFVMVVCSATVARAEPIRVTSGVVETGFAALGQPLSGQGLQLTAGALTFHSPLEDPGGFVQLAAVPTVAAGALVDFSGTLHTNGGTAGQENGAFLLAAPFTMFFGASPARITCSTANSLTQCTGTAPFTMDATLSVTTSDGRTSTRHLIGGGTVVGSLFGGGGTTESVAVRYTFAASARPSRRRCHC